MKRAVVIVLTGLMIWAARPLPAMACGPIIEVHFYESGPDLWVIKNQSQEPWTLVTLEIILTGSNGKLVFDTEEGGLGYNSPYQFEAVDNDVGLAIVPKVTDGSEKLTLSFLSFEPGKSFMFTVDIDDRVGNSEWGQGHISGNEIHNTRAEALLTSKKFGKTVAKGAFGTDGKANLRGATCV
ncbi:MAG: hypothetical protein VW268_14480 [Rhodospirillaceae bacterium]